MNLINIIDLYDYSPFENIKLPNGLDKDIVVNTIMDKCAEYTPIYPELKLLTWKIENFFAKNYDNWTKLLNAYNLEYNPIHNYDRHEEIDETYKRDRTNKLTENNTSNTVDTGKVSAFDSSAFQNSTEDTTVDTENNTHNTDEDIVDTTKKDNHLYGNIGVTTTQQMLESEIALREKFNLYDIIANAFFSEFMLRCL